MVVGGQRHTLAALYPRERPGTHCIGGWVGLRAGLDSCGKPRPPAGIRSTDRPARSKSLHRLSYPGSPLRQCAFQITNPFLNLITVRSRESVTNPDHLNKINNTWHVTYSKPIQLIQRRIYILLHASTVAVQNLTLLFRIRYVPGSILGQSFTQ